jgi:hypothetical protein
MDLRHLGSKFYKVFSFSIAYNLHITKLWKVRVSNKMLDCNKWEQDAIIYGTLIFR